MTLSCSIKSISLARVSFGSPIPLCCLLDYSHFFTAHTSFFLQHFLLIKPTFFVMAVKVADWGDAMASDSTLKSIILAVLLIFPYSKKAIGFEWVFKIKGCINGYIDHYKACLVARSYTQQEGLHYHNTFSPVAKLTKFCCLLSVSTNKGWSLYQLDVHKTFLHGDLWEEVYINLPLGFSRKGKNKCLPF